MIREAWGDGAKMSSARLAARVGEMFGYSLTRSAIAGIYNRHRALRETHPLSGDRSLVRTRKPREPKGETKPKVDGDPKPKQKRSRKSKAEVNLEHKAYDDGCPRITIEDLTSKSCRFIVTEDSPFLYCGHTVGLGGSWCDHHRSRVFVCRDVN